MTMIIMINNKMYTVKELEEKIGKEKMNRVRQYLRDNNITLLDYNRWLWENQKIEIKDRVAILDLTEEDLEGFVKLD